MSLGNCYLYRHGKTLASRTVVSIEIPQWEKQGTTWVRYRTGSGAVGFVTLKEWKKFTRKSIYLGKQCR